MRKRLEVLPYGWPCALAACIPGHFVYEEDLGFVTEYRDADGYREAYSDSGEVFWAGTKTKTERDQVIVQPVTYEWVNFAE